MHRKMILLSMALLILATGCIPVGSIEVGVEPTRVVVEPLTTEAPEVEPTEPVAEPTEVAGVESPEFGTVSGGICYPSEFVPAMTAYFREINSGMLYELEIAENQTSYTADLPAGRYIAFAYLVQQEDFGGSYSAAVPCGLTVDCVDHTPQPFDIVSGQQMVAIDLCDWYEPAAVPANPARTLSVSPTLAGMLMESSWALYLADQTGTAEQILDPYRAQEIVVNEDASMAVFTREDDLYLADLQSGIWRNLTATPDRWEMNPVWGPNGSGKVYFYSDTFDAEPMGGGQLTEINLDGGGYNVIDVNACCSAPAFDPDGTRMAYSAGETAWIYSSDTASFSEFDPGQYGLTGVRRIVSPSWSPDGQKLAWWVVIGESGQSQTALAIFDLAAETYALKHPYEPIGGGGWNSAPVWSPDGQWLATIVLSDGAKAGLYVISVNGSEEVDLGSADAPVFSLNSGALVFRQWPADGGPAWESTLMVYVMADGQIATLDAPNGVRPVAFIEP